MKKFIIATMALAASAAFAGEQSHGTAGSFTAQKQAQKTEVVSTSGAIAAAQNAGNSQVITVAPVTTNVASDLKDQGATAAATSAAAAERINAVNAATALEIARINNDTGSRDLSADQRAALDREAAIEIARIGQTVKNTPGIVLGQLVSSNDTCMGSVSVGGSGPGFSIGVGTTYTDDNCKLLKNSRELWNMGMKAASLALMCKNADNREALELTGFECPQTTAAKKAEADKAAAKKTAEVAQPVKTAQAPATVVASSNSTYTGTDPIVRARLGLAPIAASK